MLWVISANTSLGSTRDYFPDSDPYECCTGATPALSGGRDQYQRRYKACHILVCTNPDFSSLNDITSLTWFGRQDLNASIVTGSNRIVDHNTFTDLHWSRECLPSHWFQLPPGFHCRSQLLAPECLEVLEDIHALQRVREDSHFRGCGQGTLACINAHTASIQSRLVELQAVSSVSKACYLAAYLCSVMLCCKIWCELVIPVGDELPWF